jgi:hypothetical protein
MIERKNRIKRQLKINSLGEDELINWKAVNGQKRLSSRLEILISSQSSHNAITNVFGLDDFGSLSFDRNALRFRCLIQSRKRFTRI